MGKAFEDTFGVKDLDEKGYSDAFNNYSSAELKEKHAELGMAIYNLNCSDAVKRDLLQQDLDLAAANVTYKEVLESAVQSGNFSQLRQVYNKLQADLMKGAGKVDWVNYTIGIAGQNIPLYKALFEQDQYANLASLNNDKAFQIYSSISSRLGKLLASTNSLYDLRSKTIGDVGAEATNLSGRISYADDKWFNPDGSDNKEHRKELATDINRYMAMSAGSSAYVPPNIVTSIDDALKASTSPAKKLMKARIMAQEFNMSGFSDQLLRTYNEKERSGAGLTAEETFLAFAMLYGADAKSANAYDALGRDPVAVTKMFETLSDLKGDALKTAQDDVDKTIDAHDIPDEYRGAVRRALLVQYAMNADGKEIKPKGAWFSYSGDANRRDAVLKQNFVAIPGVQGSVYVRHPAFLEGNGKGINMKSVSTALDTGKKSIAYIDNSLHGTNGAVRSNKADLGVSFDHQRGIFVLTKNGLQVQSYTSKGAIPIGITPKTMLAMQERGTFVPFISMRYGFNELAQSNLSADYFSNVNKSIKYNKDEAILSPVRTKQLIHGANTLLSNEAMTRKMFSDKANTSTPVSMVLSSSPALADKSSLEYRTLYEYVKRMFDVRFGSYYGDNRGQAPQEKYMPQQSTKAKLKEKGKEVLDWQRNFPSNFQEWFQNQPSPVYREERPGYSSYIDPAEQYTSFLWRGMSFAGKVNTLPGDTTDITRSACFGNNTMLNVIAFNKDNDYVVG